MSNDQRYLSNGLCIVGLKKRTNDLVILALSDLRKTKRFMFDIVENKVVRSDIDLKLSQADISVIQARIVSLSSDKKEIKIEEGLIDA